MAFSSQDLADALIGLRTDLWAACPHEGKYGDDGELQCHGADFRRDPLNALTNHVIEAQRQARTKHG